MDVELAVLLAEVADVLVELVVDLRLAAVAAMHQPPHKDGEKGDGEGDEGDPDPGLPLGVVLQAQPVVAELGVVLGEGFGRCYLI